MDIRFLGLSGWINFIWDEINSICARTLFCSRMSFCTRMTFHPGENTNCGLGTNQPPNRCIYDFH